MAKKELTTEYENCIVKQKRKIVLNGEIDYKNGIFCDYVITNKKLTSFQFRNKKYSRLFYLKDEVLESMRNVHWLEHKKKLQDNKVKLSHNDLLSFCEFDKLYYIGAGIDGMLAKHNGDFISTPILFDQSYMKIFQKIQSDEQNCQKIVDSLMSKKNAKYIEQICVVSIPYWDIDSSSDGKFTIRMSVKLPDEIYRKLIGKYTYVNDVVKKNVFSFLNE